jgi:hypothetical protein
MKYIGLIAVFFGFVLSVGLTVSKASAAPTALSMMPGTWSCDSHGSNGKRSSTYTFTNIGDNVMQFSWVGKIHPDRKGAGVWYYDTKAHEYVSMGAGAGGWGVSRGSASPNDATVKLQDTYPPDPMNGTTTYHFSSNGVSYESRWSDKGKAMMQSGSCKKM